ncbi:hypothetical protein G6F56_003088 [Rhizopus delemar]|nr:hypothetical protein G6F56_003088 [Rhizopus delemar]
MFSFHSTLLSNDTIDPSQLLNIFSPPPTTTQPSDSLYTHPSQILSTRDIFTDIQFSSDESRSEQDSASLSDQELSDYKEEQDDEDSDWEAPKPKKTFVNTVAIKRKKSIDIDSCCFNCKVTKTTLWRRNPEGHILCNACGLFFKLHGVIRPLSLKSDVIKRRNRSRKSSSGHRRRLVKRK